MRVPTAANLLLLVATTASSLSSTRTQRDCDVPSPCMGPYEPVCASDDTTYFNACALRVAQCKQHAPSDLEILASGVCCPIACPSVDAVQVCGSDGTTYASPCDFLRARCDSAEMTLRIVSSVPCRVSSDCDGIECDAEEDNPVCGSDGRTYTNQCELARAACLTGDPEALVLSYSGPCVQGDDVVTTFSTAIETPVLQPFEVDQPTQTASAIDNCPGTAFQICASNGLTYDTVCEFTAARRVNPIVQFASLGSCQDDPPRDAPEPSADQCDFVCPAPRAYEPVCTAETEVVFPNKCAYVSALCRDLALPPARPEFCDPLVRPPAVGEFA